MCASTVNLTVQHEENVTLSCNVNSSNVVAWYRLSSEKMMLLISASRGKFKKNNFIIEHNKDVSHFELKEVNRTESPSLKIIRVGEADIGLYYCAVGISEKGMHFGTPVRLTFSGKCFSGDLYLLLPIILN